MDMRKWLLALAVTGQVFTAGCLGGDGSESHIGGVVGSGVDALSSTSNPGGDEGGGSPPGGGGGGITPPPPVASVSGPEPASVALFGGGLAGLAVLRLRKRKRSCR